MPQVIRLAEIVDDGRPSTVGDVIKISYTKHPNNGETGTVVGMDKHGEDLKVKLKSGKTVQVAIDDMEVVKWGPKSKP